MTDANGVSVWVVENARGELGLLTMNELEALAMLVD